MKLIKNLFFYCLISMPYKIGWPVALSWRRLCELSSRFRGRDINEAATSKIGSIRLLGFETWLKVINAAITKLKSEDITLYSDITAGRKCVVFAGGDPKGDPMFEVGTFFLNKAFVKSQDALVALFVF